MKIHRGTCFFLLFLSSGILAAGRPQAGAEAGPGRYHIPGTESLPLLRHRFAIASGPDTLAPSGPGRYHIPGPDLLAPSGPSRYRNPGPDSLTPSGPGRYHIPGTESLPLLRHRFAIASGPDSLTPSGPGSYHIPGTESLALSGPGRYHIPGTESLPLLRHRFAIASGPDLLAPSGPSRYRNPGPDSLAPSGPPPGKCSEQTYRVRWLPEAKIALDGRAAEPAWKEAAAEKRFVFPWKQAPAPETEFRGLCDGENLYFHFRVRDADIVVLDELRDEEDAVLEDRVEIYLSLDEGMKKYFCLEVDSRGRVFDYSGAYYRRLDPKWNLEGLAAAAAPLPDGYEVEGRVPLASLAALGFPKLGPGARVRFGMYRAEFSHDRSGKPVEKRESIHTMGRQAAGPPPIEEWLSWVDPRIKEPDFHVPATLGWLEIVK